MKIAVKSFCLCVQFTVLSFPDMSGSTDADAIACVGGALCNYGAYLELSNSSFSIVLMFSLSDVLVFLLPSKLPGWGELLTHMSPYGWGYYGIAFGLGLSVIGAAWGIWLTGSSLTGAAVKAPRIRSKNLIRWAFFERPHSMEWSASSDVKQNPCNPA
jgi:V-type H+-transporting ATPase proteolipid subunit